MLRRGGGYTFSGVLSGRTNGRKADLSGGTLAIDSNHDNVCLALLVAAGLLVLSVIPIWPYGLYTVLRLVITGVALFAIYGLGISNTKQTIGLVVVALLFNPVVPVPLPQLIWIPIELSVAFWFWKISQSDAVINGSRE